MHIKYIPVVHPSLKEYIDYYYIFSTEGNQKTINYRAYPDPNVPLCFIPNCCIIHQDGYITVAKKQTQAIRSIIVGHSSAPVDISFEPGLKEFAIVFKPFGIHLLLKKRLGRLLSNGPQETDLFDYLKESILLIIAGNEDVSCLENLILQNMNTTAELNHLNQIITILQTHHQISIEEITLKIDFPYKNIYRLLKSHKGLSPVQFKRILKFRNALEKSINPAYRTKMTAVALESGYYDQAHYINEIKRVARSTPKDLSYSQWLVNDKKTVWKLY